MSISAQEINDKKRELTAPGAYFEVQEVLVDGRGYPGFKNAPATALDILKSARNHGDLEFIVYEDQRLTYDEMFTRADALAAQLQGHYDIRKSDRVAIAMRNNPQWVISYCATLLAGAVVVPINSWGKSEELEYAIRDCGASLLVCDDARYGLIDQRIGEIGIPTIVVPSDTAFESTVNVSLFDDVVSAGEGNSCVTPDIGPKDHALILYTSGSTGFPKGVIHRHVAIGQALMNMMFLGLLVSELENGPREYRGGAERETPMLTIPLFHASGMLGGLVMPMALGHKVIMMYKWDAAQALSLIEQERVTGLSTVPAILKDLLNHPDFANYDTESLMRVAAAGAATPAGLPELIESRVEDASRSAGYGMTESLGQATTMSGILFDYKPDSCGIVSPIMEMRFVAEDGSVQPDGVPGEIEMRSICCTPRYWEKPEANAETFDAIGWMKTGDVGALDEDGFLHITGRIKEIVIRGGENIFPGEIEQAAFEMPQVHEVVVFGEPDEAMGEELVMVIYPAKGSHLDAARVREFLDNRLAAYKVPRTVVFWDQPLPRNASEKLHKLKVKEIYLTTR